MTLSLVICDDEAEVLVLNEEGDDNIDEVEVLDKREEAVDEVRVLDNGDDDFVDELVILEVEGMLDETEDDMFATIVVSGIIGN